VVRQLLAFSRSTASERQRIALGPLVEETLTFLRASLPPQVQLDSCIRHEVGEVLADPTQLQQVVMNLCINGAQAMGEKGGLLEVSLHSVELETPLATDSCTLDPGAYILLTVRDAGCGMTPEVKQRIFEPFFTTKEIGAGSGLGLAVVHGIIRSHGGAILVESQPGKGSMLQVFLPRDRHEIRTVIAEDRYWDADLVQANGEKGGPRSGTYSSH
jgi:two-component system, cell cycle sensor histidine kinase and response regulator CckA